MRPYATWPKAFLDIETTGLNPVFHDVIEVAVVRTDAPPLVTKVKPLGLRMKNASADALLVNGYNEAEWRDAPSWGDVAPDVSKALNGCAIIGHNVGFDLKFLEPKLDPLGLGIRTRPRIVLDTMALAFAFLTPRGLKRLRLAECCDFLGIEPEARTHRAMAGAMSAKRVYEAIVRIEREEAKKDDPANDTDREDDARSGSAGNRNLSFPFASG